MKGKISDHTWLIILVAVGLGFSYPAIGELLAPLLKPLLMVLMFLSLLSIRFRNIIKQLKEYRSILLILAIIHLVSPLIVLTLRSLIHPDIFLGLILAASMSSGLSVVFLSKLFKGKPGSALAITGISNMITPFVVPLIVGLLTKQVVAIDPVAMAQTIALFIFVPLIAVKIIQRTPLYKPLTDYSSPLSIATLFLLVVTIISPIREIVLTHLTESLIVSGVVLALITLNFSLGSMIGKSRAEKITFGITASYKNFTLATVVALSLFGPLVALPAALYTVINNVLLAPLQVYLTKHR